MSGEFNKLQKVFENNYYEYFAAFVPINFKTFTRIYYKPDKWTCHAFFGNY